MAPRRWLLYGANGFTGRKILERAVLRGHRPTIAGRSAEKIASLGAHHAVDHLAFDLTSPTILDRHVQSFDLVVNIAGPFVATADPMLESCLRCGTDYIDIGGELSVFESIFARERQVIDAGIRVIPGCGFDVVPTDSLARSLAESMPDAVSLEIAVSSDTALSPGTLKAGTGSIARGGYEREDGVLHTVRFGRRGPNIRFHNGERRTIEGPFADLVTAWHTTGIPTIHTYFALPPGAGAVTAIAPLVETIFSITPLRRLINAGIDLAFTSKDGKKVDGDASIWSRVRNRNGKEIEGWMFTPEPYRYTADVLIQIIERFSGRLAPGVHTPAGAFGPDIALTVDGTHRYERFPL